METIRALSTLGTRSLCRALGMAEIWHNNRNPRIIASYYLEAARAAGGNTPRCYGFPILLICE